MVWCGWWGCLRWKVAIEGAGTCWVGTGVPGITAYWWIINRIGQLSTWWAWIQKNQYLIPEIYPRVPSPQGKHRPESTEYSNSSSAHSMEWQSLQQKIPAWTSVILLKIMMVIVCSTQLLKCTGLVGRCSLLTEVWVLVFLGCYPIYGYNYHAFFLSVYFLYWIFNTIVIML